MCGKKEPDQEGDEEESGGKSDLIDWWDCQKYKRWFCSRHQKSGSKSTVHLASEEWVKKHSAFSTRRVGQKAQCI